MPAPIVPLLGFALGVALAWLARPDAERDASLWDRATLAVALYAALVYAPAAAYFLIFAADWSFAYLVDGRAVPSAIGLLLVLLDAASIPCGFVAGRLVLRRRSLVALAWLALAPAAAAAAFVVALHGRLGIDATYDQVRSDFGLRPLPGSPLGWAILWMDGLVVAGAVFTARALTPTALPLAPAQAESRPPPPAPGGSALPAVAATDEDEPPRWLGRGKRRW